MTVFLFTDLESSTRLWQQFPGQMAAVIGRHDHLLTALIEGAGGQVIKNTGDGLFAIFEAGDPLNCALDIQTEIAHQDWGAVGDLRARVALHRGAAIRQGDDYLGLDINRTARLLTAGWGGQVLLSGELAQAAALPGGASLRDLGVHLLKDLSEPLQIFELTHPDLPLQVFPALRTLSAHPHNLPAQPTAFIGRAAELAAITGYLARPDGRLLTLLGPGGIGKTRLALQAAADQVEAFPHGVFFVPLAPLEAGESLVPAIAEALRFTFYQREQPRRQLLDYLQGKHLLLVLDNFEHLVTAAGLVSEMLAAAPQLKVLVTSRERLNLREEQVFPVEGMRFPAFDTIADMAEYSALKLFVQSARRARPGYELVPAEWQCAA
ncbi:MAG: adenylate/guanylate cyclase domain-containing protein, partial [Anaerolineales bacterium]|nr:adenylate/guanylate cyclase domain-containing protein [Anaerolineales bacterium]